MGQQAPGDDGEGEEEGSRIRAQECFGVLYICVVCTYFVCRERKKSAEIEHFCVVCVLHVHMLHIYREEKGSRIRAHDACVFFECMHVSCVVFLLYVHML